MSLNFTKTPVFAITAGLGVVAITAITLFGMRKSKKVPHQNQNEPIVARRSRPIGWMKDRVKEFGDLMSEFNIPIDNQVIVGETDYLDQPVSGRLYTGCDPHGRVFINVPVVIKMFCRRNLTADPTSVYKVRHTFTVFQRYTGNRNIFVIGNHPPCPHLLSCYNEDQTPFYFLRQLLNKETVKIDTLAISGGATRTDPTDPSNWVEMHLDPEATWG